MAFYRLLIVTALVSILGGLFGASVGALLGYAVPSSLSVFFGTDANAKHDKNFHTETPAAGEPINRRVELGVDAQKNMAAQGAAVGGALGLVVGAFLGFLLGIVDQSLHLIRGIFHARKEAALHAMPATRGPPA